MAARPWSFSPSGLTYSPSLVQKAATALASPALNALVNASADWRTAATSAPSFLPLSPGVGVAAGAGGPSWAAGRHSQPAVAATTVTRVTAAARKYLCLLMVLLLERGLVNR